MATLNNQAQTVKKPSSMAQSEIDRHNRYLTRFNTMANPTQADKDTVGQIKNLYGSNFNQAGIDPTKWSGQSQQSYLLENPYQQANAAKQDYSQGVTNAQNSYQNSQAKADANKWNNATIQDLASKYGFDYSRDYAKQQAEAEAQALRNANANAVRQNETSNKLNKTAIDNNLMNEAEALDRNYFQKYLTQAQDQTNSGLNAGIASDQDLRLQMNRQAEMGDSYRDASLGKMTEDQRFSNTGISLTEGLGLINQQALAREDSLYNDRLQQGFGNLQSERGYFSGLDQQEWSRSQTDIDRAMQLYQTNLGQANYQSGDAYNRLQDTVANKLQQAQFDWSKRIDESQLTGNMNGQRTLAGSQFDWSKSQDLISNQQWEKEFNENVRQFGLEYALQVQSMRQAASGGGGGRSSGGSGGYSGTTAGTTQSAPAKALAKDYSSFKASANSQANTFEDQFYLPKIEAINKLVSPTNQKAYSKAVNNIKAPTYYDRALSLFK